LVDNTTTKKITISWHESETSLLEGVFARGDRRLSEVILRAYELGCKFDSWGECFDFEKWNQAFEDCSLDPAFYANRKREYSEILPWDHLDYYVSKDFLIKENQLAHSEKTTPNCREKCANCGAAVCKTGVCYEKR
jgi:hypothetical protein